MHRFILICMLVVLLTFVLAVSTYSLEILELGGNTEPENWDLQALQKFPEVAGKDINYTATRDRTLSDLDIESFDLKQLAWVPIQDCGSKTNKE